MGKLKIVWTLTAKNQLKAIFDFYSIKSLVGAKNIKNDILNTTKNIVFSKQYQLDEIEPNFRRIIVRHYKVIYIVCENEIQILRIFDTRRNPSVQIDY
jgi:plasmid stabilization system protein ParE